MKDFCRAGVLAGWTAGVSPAFGRAAETAAVQPARGRRDRGQP